MANDSLNWSELAFELDLDAIARQIVLNAVVRHYHAGRLELAILTEMEVILKPEVREQIKRALEVKLGVSLSLEFISQSALDVETPQQADDRKQEQARQAAIEQIRQDPMVKQLSTLFSAELVESSVKKTRSE